MVSRRSNLLVHKGIASQRALAMTCKRRRCGSYSPLRGRSCPRCCRPCCERSEPSRYRLNREDFSEIPFPDIKSVQAKIVQEIHARTSQARQLREAAQREWQEAKEKFEKALLGSASKRHCEEQWRNKYPTDISPGEFRMNNR